MQVSIWLIPTMMVFLTFKRFKLPLVVVIALIVNLMMNLNLALMMNSRMMLRHGLPKSLLMVVQSPRMRLRSSSQNMPRSMDSKSLQKWQLSSRLNSMQPTSTTTENSTWLRFRLPLWMMEKETQTMMCAPSRLSSRPRKWPN